jgi:hypothetical protein
MKKKPDRKFVIAVLALLAGAAAAKGVEVQKVTKEPVSGAYSTWLQSQLR